MPFEEIPLEQIDLGNEMFRISEDLDPASVLESLREIGQLNPVLLLQRNSRKIPVCGFRRIRAMKRLGMHRVLARILPEESCGPVRTFGLALWDNLSHRQLNPLEKARVLSGFRKFGVPDVTLVGVYLPLMGLNPAESVLRSYILLNGISHDLRLCLIEGRLTQPSIEAVAHMPHPVEECFVSLMGKIRLSAGLQKKLLALLDDLAAGAENRPAVLLNSPEVLEMVNDSRLSPFQKGEKLYEFLYRVRYPRLSEALDKFASRKKQLRLPGTVRIAAHPFFEEPGLRVEFDAPDIERFRNVVAALQEAAQSQELKKLFAPGE